MRQTAALNVCIVLLGIGMISVGFSLVEHRSEITALQKKITSLEEGTRDKLAVVESRLVNVKEVLDIHQQANEEQDKVNKTFLSFIQLINESKGQ